MCFIRKKTAKRLAAIGSCVDTSYMLYVNNENPISFPCKDDLLSYLSEFRQNNVISRLQIYRIETYSL